MISGISNIKYVEPRFSKQDMSTIYSMEPMSSFSEEDNAIISSQANLLNELDKYNSGGNNDLDLALANVISTVTVSAEVNVINTKKAMMDTILGIAG